MKKSWISVFALTAALGCSSGGGEQCSAPAQCPSGKGSYQACTSTGSTSCRLLTSDGTSYSCATCADCAAATQQAVTWCLGGGGGRDGGVVLPGAATIVANSSQQITVGTTPYVAVDLTLTNNGITALPLVATLFAVATADGLQYRGDARTATYTGGCDPNASLTTGHSIECTVLFSVPFTKTPNLLSYTLPDGTSVSAPLSTMTCTLCGGKCVDLLTDPKNCGACFQVVAGGTCVNGAPACNSGLTACAGGCVDTMSDNSNCGGCGKACFGQATCFSGHCTTTVTSTMRTSCSVVCGSQTCYLADSDYQSGSCSGGEFPLASCTTVAPATQSANGCSYTFNQMVCQCGP
jgi:hypothetical protein